ncbi:uncharacterized protein [Amphiura filiformis]|uniref:uncharacterized protein isoform X1 n=1 Tax=Amphiura filiformis TaxID=82378 RepID=UPI003B210AD6
MTSQVQPATKVSNVDIESLESLCLQQIARNLKTYCLEGLPTLFLQKLLPVLSVHDLHSLHHVIKSKGLDSQPFWYKYYTEAFEKGWQGKKCYCIPQEGHPTPDWRQCYLDQRCSMLLNTQFITLLMPGAQPVTPSYSQKLTSQALKHPMIDPQQMRSQKTVQPNPVIHHPECLSLRAGSCSFLLDVQDVQSHLCASVKELQIDHLQEKYTEQVGLLLTILLGHGMIDKLTLRHSRLAQVAQLKEILQICAGPPEEATEAMDTQELVGEVKSESSGFEGQFSQVSRCNEDPSGSLPLKIAKTDMEMQKSNASDHMTHVQQGVALHHGAWQSCASTVNQSSAGNLEDSMPGVCETGKTKPEEDLFDYCFTEPIKAHDGHGAPLKCPSKRQPHFSMQIPKKKYDMRSTQDRTRQGMRTGSALIECQLCRALQYKAMHTMRAITHVVLLGFTLDVRDCIAIGDVLAWWAVLKASRIGG